MALLIGGIVIVGTIAVALLMIFAASMSDAPRASDDVGKQALAVLVIGVIIGALIITSHWFHLSW
ncbi:MAG: hypothetical protein KGL39_38320 [Patescibacteria group bacterium]|nr:hypothetical protein [Patescibacteria group bacterium]